MSLCVIYFVNNIDQYKSKKRQNLGFFCLFTIKIYYKKREGFVGYKSFLFLLVFLMRSHCDIYRYVLSPSTIAISKPCISPRIINIPAISIICFSDSLIF